MGKNIGKTGMGGAGKLKEEGQTKKKKCGDHTENRGEDVTEEQLHPQQHNLQKADCKPLVPA